MDNDLAIDAPGIGHNARPIDLVRERVEALAETANEWIGTIPQILDKETARRADDFLSQITGELKKVETQRKAEAKPHQDAAKAINLAYQPLILVLEMAKSLFEPRIRDWLH